MATKHGYRPQIVRHVGIKRTKSYEKYKKAIDRYIDLLKKEKKQGQTKWILFTKQKAIARLQAYGITIQQINKALDRKGLSSLSITTLS